MSVRVTQVDYDGAQPVVKHYDDDEMHRALSPALLDLVHNIAVTAVVLQLQGGGFRRYERIDTTQGEN